MEGRDDIAERVRAAERRFREAQPGDIRNFLAFPRAGAAYVPDTGVPIVGTRYLARADGLVIPETAARGPAPINLIASYLTFSEVFGRPAGNAEAVRWLQTIERETALRACAFLLAERAQIGSNQIQLDAALARRAFREPDATRVANLVLAGRLLVSPQGILMVAKLALTRCPDVGSRDDSMIAPAILAVQDGLAPPDDSRDEDGRIDPGTRLFREVIRSQAFGSTTDEGSLMARFHLRWREVPADLQDHGEWVALEATFASATGVPLTDLTIIGIALWSRAIQAPGEPIALSWLSSLNWSSDRLGRALGLIARDAGSFAGLIAEQELEFGADWSFDPLRRFPVVELPNDRLLVLSPALLLEHAFGWLPLFDMSDALVQAGSRPLATRATNFFRKVCEVLATRTLALIAGGPAGRFHGEESLQTAFGRGRTADAAIEYGDAWIVAEVSSAHLSRPSIVGDVAHAIEADLRRMIDEKADQLDATIRALIADESRLTGAPSRDRRRYVPVLVITEGFPVNPYTLVVIEERLRRLELFADRRVAPLHIVDQEELDIVAGVVDCGGPSLLALLEEHEAGSLRRMPFKDWLILEKRLPAIRGTHLARAFEAAWRPAVDALRHTDPRPTS